LRKSGHLIHSQSMHQIVLVNWSPDEFGRRIFCSYRSGGFLNFTTWSPAENHAGHQASERHFGRQVRSVADVAGRRNGFVRRWNARNVVSLDVQYRNGSTKSSSSHYAIPPSIMRPVLYVTIGRNNRLNHIISSSKNILFTITINSQHTARISWRFRCVIQQLNLHGEKMHNWLSCNCSFTGKGHRKTFDLASLALLQTLS
jgi:hypothetical protein